MTYKKHFSIFYLCYFSYSSERKAKKPNEIALKAVEKLGAKPIRMVHSNLMQRDLLRDRLAQTSRAA